MGDAVVVDADMDPFLANTYVFGVDADPYLGCAVDQKIDDGRAWPGDVRSHSDPAGRGPGDCWNDEDGDYSLANEGVCRLGMLIP